MSDPTTADRVAVELHTSDFRGDHAAEVVHAHIAKDGETVAQLVDRLLLAGEYSPGAIRGNNQPQRDADFIVLRLRAEPADPPAANPWPDHTPPPL